MSRPTKKQIIFNVASILDENHNGRMDIDSNFLAKKVVDYLESLEIVPHEYHSSGCLHSMREMCNCQGTYEFGYREG